MRYIITEDRETAEKYRDELDVLCGYPNPATLTEHAVAIESLPDGRFAVPVPDGVYAPKLARYIMALDALPAARQDDLTATSDSEVAAAKKALEDSGKLSKTPPKGDVNNYVLVSRDYIEQKREAKLVEPGDAEPITDINP